MASEYRFDYGKAKPNRFAEKMNLNIGWRVEKFVAEEKKENGKKKEGKKPAKAKAPVKVKKSAPKKSATKAPAKKTVVKTTSKPGRRNSFDEDSLTGCCARVNDRRARAG